MSFKLTTCAQRRHLHRAVVSFDKPWYSLTHTVKWLCEIAPQPLSGRLSPLPLRITLIGVFTLAVCRSVKAFIDSSFSEDSVYDGKLALSAIMVH